MEAIHTRARFIEWARENKLRPDWHEPDEQGITARVEGTPLDFDNAGFWPFGNGYQLGGQQYAELHAVFSESGIEDGQTVRGRDLACVNLATLCAWATGYEDLRETGQVDLNALKVWAVLTGPTSNRKVRWLYKTEMAALRRADEYTRQHDRQTPADVTCMTVED